ncbi:MAG: hypothetical protein ACREGF_01730, partial [Candidatus Saccharimonadales bacterium]
MPNQPPFLLATRLQTQLIGILLAVDVFDVLPKEARLINSLRREVADARLDIRDYEMSQTRDEQIENAKVAKKR